MAEKLSQVDFEIKRAELVTQSLREERQLASRLHQGIQSLRGAKAKKPAGTLALMKRPEPAAETGEGATDGAAGQEPIVAEGATGGEPPFRDGPPRA